MKLQRRILSLLTVSLVVVVVGGALAWRLLGREATAPPEDELPDIEGVRTVSADQLMGSQPVLGAVVLRDTLWLRVVRDDAVAEASRESAVGARAAGVVQRVFVREGDPVREGQILVQIDTAEAAMALTRVRAQLLQAEAQYRERMRGGGGILTPDEERSRERIVRAQSGLNAVELDLQQALINLEFTRVRAPFGGRVADLRAVEGAYLRGGEEVLTLLQLDPIRVSVEVLEDQLGLLAPGHRASVRFNALGGATRTATVESVNPLVGEQRTGRVTLVLPNPEHSILPGSAASVRLDTEGFPDRILIPREAVLTRGDRRQDAVFVLTDPNPQGHGIAEMRFVALGRRSDTHVEVVPSDETEMLEPGEIVLTDRHQFLAFGTLVHLIEPVAPPGGQDAAPGTPPGTPPVTPPGNGP